MYMCCVLCVTRPPAPRFPLTQLTLTRSHQHNTTQHPNQATGGGGRRVHAGARGQPREPPSPSRFGGAAGNEECVNVYESLPGACVRNQNYLPAFPQTHHHTDTITMYRARSWTARASITSRSSSTPTRPPLTPRSTRWSTRPRSCCGGACEFVIWMYTGSGHMRRPKPKSKLQKPLSLSSTHTNKNIPQRRRQVPRHPASQASPALQEERPGLARHGRRLRHRLGRRLVSEHFRYVRSGGWVGGCVLNGPVGRTSHTPAVPRIV